MKRLLSAAIILILGVITPACGLIYFSVNQGATPTLSLYGVSTIGTNACRLFMIKSVDSSGAYSTLSSNLTVNFSGAGSGAFYSDPGCTSPASLITMAAGTSYKLIYFKDASVENLTFYAAGVGANTARLSINTVAGGTSWTNKTAGLTLSPPALDRQMAVFHLTRASIIIYGGDNNASVTTSDMWEYTGTTWTQLCSGCAPGARKDSVMVYDSARNVIVLFGGGTATATYKNDVWEWDGSTWTQRTNILGTPPSKRGIAYGAYDSARQKVVIFGGRDTTSTDLNDLFEYDGVTWTNPTPGGLPSIRRGLYQCAYDPVNSWVIFYGGHHLAVYNDNYYTWDGTTSTLRAAGATGTGRDGAFVDFDASRNKLVVVQGVNGGGEIAGTWEVNGTTFASVGPVGGDPENPGNVRDSGTLTYNPFTAKLIYYGGNTCGAGCNWAETWEYGAP